MKHAHAELLHRLADDCDLLVWCWNYLGEPTWYLTNVGSLFRDKTGGFQFALCDKPTSPPKRYAMVEGVKVPMTHLTVEPEYGTKFWYTDASLKAWWKVWSNDFAESAKLTAQNLYATEADAQEAATA